MADLAQLEEQIVSLSLLEAAALVKKLEERLGVSAAAAAPVAAAGGAGAGAAAPFQVSQVSTMSPRAQASTALPSTIGIARPGCLLNARAKSMPTTISS